jgi:peroxiredoxin
MIARRLTPYFYFIILLPTLLRADTVTVLGARAPFFNLPNQNSSAPAAFKLSSQFSPDSQHAVIVSFFASWCAPCRQELPFLQSCSDSLAPQGLRLVAICLDPLYIKNQRQMVREMKLTCPVLHDRNGTLAMRFGFKKSLPYSVFITRKGVIAGVSTGYDTTRNAGIYEKIRGILEQ